jgi:hypothetical protein
MGKQRRRMYSPKFAKKYAALRAARGVLQDTIEEALEDNIITEIEAAEIQEAEENVANALKQLPPEEAVVQIEEPVTEIVEEKPKPKPRAARKTTTAKPKAKRTRKSRKPKASAEG